MCLIIRAPKMIRKSTVGRPWSALRYEKNTCAISSQGTNSAILTQRLSGDSFCSNGVRNRDNVRSEDGVYLIIGSAWFSYKVSCFSCTWSLYVISFFNNKRLFINILCRFGKFLREPYLPGFSSKKHVVAPNDPNVHNSFPWAASGLNFNIIRFAEVLLWRAEALIESNKDLDEARGLINQVRERAKNSDYVQKLDGSADAANYNIGLYPPAGWTQDYARKALRFERRLELAMEGHRFYDLNRWGITATTINDYFLTESERVEYLQGMTFQAGKHEYLPIPQQEIDLAPNLYTQNPNY
jgi:hypothetical protein